MAEKRAILPAGILLCLGGAGVGDGEAAICGGDDFEPGAISSAFEIGYAIIGAVVGGIGVFGGVEHPQVFKAGALMDGLPGFRTTGFVGSVVHDGDAGMDCIDEGLGVGEVEAVMVDEIEIDRADEIIGADERDLFGLGEVAEIEEAEFAVGEEDAG